MSDPRELLGKPLTAKQQEILDLRQAGKTNKEIAAMLGISENVVVKQAVVARRKAGIAPATPSQRARQQGCEYQNPELAAAAIEAAADPLARTQKEAIDRVNAQLKAAGMPGRVSEVIVRRMLVKYANVVMVKKQLTTQEILKSIDEELSLVSSYIDDKVAAEANLRDLGMFKAAMIEKRALLRGEPTAIISDHERKKLHELLPALLEEGRRRGITFEGVVTEKIVGPG